MKDKSKTKDKLGVLLKSGLTDSQKLAVYRNRISDERDDDIELFKKAGMDIDDFMTVQQKYADINDTDKSATDKELEFIRWVYSGKYSSKQREAIKETFAYYHMSRANADKYEALRSSKLSDDKASKVVKAISSLKPTQGNTDVKDWQKWDAICKLSLTDKEKSEALRAYMTDDQEKKYNIAEKYFISADEYAEAQKLVAEKLAEKMKQSGSKSASITQDELEEILNSMGKSALFGIGLTSRQKAALWQLIGGWKTKNNPYDKETANAVYDELQKSKKSGTASGTDKASELRKALGIG